MKKVLAAVTLLVFILLTGCESGESFLGTVIRMDEETMVCLLYTSDAADE